MARRHVKKITTKRLFFLSGGDMEIESRLLPAIVERVNKPAEGVSVEAAYWGGLRPGAKGGAGASPLDLKGYDLLIFLLGKSWGRGPGADSSYKRIYTAAKRAARDRIFYFRAMADEDLVRRDDRVAGVVAFCDGIEKDRSEICFWYDDPKRWKEMIEGHLRTWLGGTRPQTPALDTLPDHQRRLDGWREVLNKSKTSGSRAAFRMVRRAYDYAGQRRLTRARVWFARAVAAAREPYIINEYGILLKENGLLTLAGKVFENLARLGQLTGDKLVMGSALRHLGDVSERNHDLAKADTFYRKAITFEKDLGRTVKQASLYQTRGMVHFKTGDLDAAQEMFARALELYQAAGLIEGQALVYYCLTGVHIQRYDPPAAMHACEKAMELFEQLGADEMIARLQSLLSAIEKIGK